MPSYKKSVKGTTATSKSTLLPLSRKTTSLRSQNVQIQDQNKDVVSSRAKRRGDISPIKNEKIKRSALGNLTNNVINNNNENNTDHHHHNQKENNAKSKLLKVPTLTTNKYTTATNNVLKAGVNNENSMMPPAAVNDIVLRPTKILTRAAAKNAAGLLSTATAAITNNMLSVGTSKFYEQQQPSQTISTAKTKESKNATAEMTQNVKPTTRRISNEFEKTEDSLYMSALEDMPSTDSLRLSGNFDFNKRQSFQKDVCSTAIDSASKKKSDTESEISSMSIDEEGKLEDNSERILTPSPIKHPRPPVPEGVNDFDAENMDDPFQVSEYAMDIFEYLKNKEAEFPIEDYIEKQVYLSKWMRSLLVDWMVEVQETFELNHETLYLAVKLVDLYLGKEVVIKDKLQLVGAGALFIACKFDERTPPLIDDFLYICDGAYNHDELVKIEMRILKTVNFELGIPLSYRFLRRYARCAKIPMPTLTLARYILEFSLMDYATISLSDSKMACAVLFMALRMTGTDKAWNKTLEYYSGYKLEDFAYIVPILNNGLHRKPRETIKTIHNKYSHKIFFEVAKIPLMSIAKLFENTTFFTNNN